MKFYIYGYKTTDEGMKAVYQGITDSFIKAIQAAKAIFVNGAKCNVICQGKKVIEY